MEAEIGIINFCASSSIYRDRMYRSIEKIFIQIMEYFIRFPDAAAIIRFPANRYETSPFYQAVKETLDGGNIDVFTPENILRPGISHTAARCRKTIQIEVQYERMRRGIVETPSMILENITNVLIIRLFYYRIAQTAPASDTLPQMRDTIHFVAYAIIGNMTIIFQIIRNMISLFSSDQNGIFYQPQFHAGQ